MTEIIITIMSNNVFAVTVVAFLLMWASVAESGGQTVDVSTTSGVVRGKTVVSPLNVAVNQWLAIPYAQPPIGNLRFAKPEAITSPLEGVIDGSKFSHACMQTIPLSNGVLDMNEDCLYLNVWSPQSDDATLKPVMFYIHGGGYVWGTSSEPTYNGASLASHDVVVVTINYRLGHFGFLYGGDDSAPGNVGLYDQLLALKWVRDNIEAFGGDKDQITIAGESAGGWSVSVWLTSPLASGLYKRAIIESGSYMFNKDRDLRNATELLNEGKALAAKLLCTGSDWLQCLRGKGALNVQVVSFDATLPLNAFVLSGTELLPYSERDALLGGHFNKDLEVMAGVMSDEGIITAPLLSLSSLAILTKPDFVKHVDRMNTVFHNLNTSAVTDFYLKGVNLLNPIAVKAAYNAFIGDLFIKCPTYRFAKRYAEQSDVNNVYFYEWTYAALNLPSGTPALHTGDLYYVFGVVDALPLNTQMDADFSRDIMTIWTDFIKYGKPTDSWPKLVSTEANSMPQIQELNPNHMNNVFKDRYRNTCDGFWNNYY